MCCRCAPLRAVPRLLIIPVCQSLRRSQHIRRGMRLVLSQAESHMIYQLHVTLRDSTPSVWQR